MSVGIIAEYNPFHNGHLHHLNKIKEMFPDDTIILITNSYFSQRGDVSFINKWDKTNVCLELGIHLIVELPFVFATQSADLFARGAIELLEHLKVDKLVFGSESNDINLLKEIATINQQDEDIDKYLKKGFSYPKSIACLIKDKYGLELKTPNDILGVCYIKEINRLKSKIKPICIKRTNDYHSLELEKIASASSIRKAIKDGKNIEKYIPKTVIKSIKPHYIEEFFNLLKYKILTEDNLSKYQTVDEGIEYRLKKYILKCNNMDELIEMIKTKRYTYNRIKRMFTHILCHFTKDMAKNIETEYIRILGFDKLGQNYLNKIKKELQIPLLTKYHNFKNLEIEIRSTIVYSLLENNLNLVELEYKNKPIKKGSII